MGISVARMTLLSFGLAAAIGAVAGVVVAPTTSLEFDTGRLFTIAGFIAVVIGGISSLPGAVLGGAAARRGRPARDGLRVLAVQQRHLAAPAAGGPGLPAERAAERRHRPAPGRARGSPRLERHHPAAARRRLGRRRRGPRGRAGGAAAHPVGRNPERPRDRRHPVHRPHGPRRGDGLRRPGQPGTGRVHGRGRLHGGVYRHPIRCGADPRAARRHRCWPCCARWSCRWSRSGCAASTSRSPPWRSGCWSIPAPSASSISRAARPGWSASRPSPWAISSSIPRPRCITSS